MTVGKIRVNLLKSLKSARLAELKQGWAANWAKDLSLNFITFQ